MVTKALKENTKNYLNILNYLSSWDNEQHRMFTNIFFGRLGPEKIEIKSELTSYDKILYSFPVVDFLESWLRILSAKFLWKRKSWPEW